MVPQSEINRAVSVARQLEAQGHFERARRGDVRAASLFARLVAYTVNPTGDPDGFGWLTKSAGETHVDGYADGAIVYGDDEDDLQNVLKIVRQVGGDASIGSDIQTRRSNNRWARPLPLTADELSYLRPGGAPVPVPTPGPVGFPPRNETLAAFEAINGHYKNKLKRHARTVDDPPLYIDNEGIAVWLQQYLLYRVQGQAHTAAVDQVLRDIDAA